MAGKFKDLEALFDKRRDEARHGSRDDRDGGKPSWRDLDRKRDRSSHTDQDRRPDAKKPKDRYQSAQAQKALAGQLDALFEDKEATAMRKAILDAEDRAALNEAVAAWVDAKGAFPSTDPDLLEKALDARKGAHLLLVVQAVGEHLKDTDPTRRKMFLLKLRGKGRTVFDKKVGAAIRQILAEHGEG